MRYRRLGRTGLLVSELCLGTNTFGGSGPPWDALGALDQPACNAVMRAAFDGGVNFLDTADIYGAGDSERRIGQGLRELGIDRSALVIASKVGGRTGPGINESGSSRAHLTRALDASLARLGTDYLDLLMLHFPDPATPLDETLSTLDDFVRAGRLRYIGCSNYPAWLTMQAVEISRAHAWARFAVQESHWSAATRDVERELVPMARAAGIGLLVWGPLLGGLLAGKYDGGAGEGEGRTGGRAHPAIDPDRLRAAIGALREVATAHSLPMAQVALAWVLAHREVSSVLFGARNAEQVKANLGATGILLSEAEIALIDAAAPPLPSYGEAAVEAGSRERLVHAG